MPQQVLPSESDFKVFTKFMLGANYRQISREESSVSSRRLGLSAPRPIKGREVGFSFSANGLNVCVWTTFLEGESYARDNDSGWVVITEGDSPRYFSHPMMRTQNFLPRLFTYALIAKQRILKRPLCQSCRAYMKIAYGTGRKSRYWKCSGKSRWHQTQMLSWDYGLSDESVIFLRAERKARRRYRGSDEGKKVVVPAILRRKSWIVKNPQNKI